MHLEDDWLNDEDGANLKTTSTPAHTTAHMDHPPGQHPPQVIHNNPAAQTPQPSTVQKVPTDVKFSIDLPPEIIGQVQSKMQTTSDVINFINQIEEQNTSAIDVVHLLNDIVKGFNENYLYGVTSFSYENTTGHKCQNALELIQFIMNSLNDEADSVTIRRYENKDKQKGRFSEPLPESDREDQE